jgi:CheY-like chemotaxis protein
MLKPILKSILVVEDNPNDLELTVNALEKALLANEIIIARDGAEAADYLFRRNRHANRPAGNPAVVLLDLKLPKIDGLELLKMVRENEEIGRTPIVLLTSSREERDVVNGYKLGVNAYVVKPVDFAEFVQAIQELGAFWAVLNEPPPPGARRSAVPHG